MEDAGIYQGYRWREIRHEREEMTTYFVSRHKDAILWAAEMQVKAEKIIRTDNLDPAILREGDEVIGTLPVHMIAEVCARGARYFHLTMEIPAEYRGEELSAQQMKAFNARLLSFNANCTGMTKLSGNTDDFFSRPHVQICIATGRNESNYLLAKQFRPQKVFILHSDSDNMRVGATRLCKALSDEGIASECIEGLTSNPVEIRQIAQSIATILRENFKNVSVIYNATGGTKVMSIAFATTFFGQPDSRVAYVDAKEQSVAWLSPSDLSPVSLAPDLLTLEHFLEMNGYKIDEAKSDSAAWREEVLARRDLTEELAKKLCLYHRLRSSLNLISMQSEGSKQIPPKLDISEKHKSPELVKLLEKMLAFGLVNDNLSAFTTPEAQRYANGGWLEEYCWLQAHDVPGANVVASSLVIKKPQLDNSEEYSKNELDLLVIANNHVLLVECKAARMDGERDKSEDVYKLDSLGRDLGGEFITSWLCSAGGLPEHLERRARQQRIDSVHGSDVLKLREKLLHWVSKHTVS